MESEDMFEYEQMQEHLLVVKDIEPYQYEPEPTAGSQDSEENASGSDSEDEEDRGLQDNEPNDRVGNVKWCTCGHCVPMQTQRESICCQEKHAFAFRLQEADVGCITQHEGFEANCLNRRVLEMSFYEYLQDAGPIGDNEPRHEIYRYIAYRRLSRFIYFRLCRHDRRIHPACAVSKIRSAFPSQEYCGFQYP